MTGCLKRLAVFLVVIALLLMIAWLLFYFIGRAKLRDEIDAWRALGGSTDLRDFAPAPIPDSDNAAILYVKAFDALPPHSNALDEYISNRQPGAVPPPEFVECAESLELARQASSIKDCVWPGVDYTHPISSMMSISRNSEVRRLARILAADAQLRADVGDLSGAIRDLEDGLNLSLRYSSDPILINLLVTVAVDDLMISTYREIFADREIPADSKVAQILADRPYFPLARRAILAEGSNTLMLYERGEFPHFSHAVKGVPGVSTYDMATFLRGLEKYIQIYDQPPAVKAVPSWDAYYAYWSAEPIAVKSFLFTFETIHLAMAISHSRCLTAQLATDLRAYKTTHGSYPRPDEFNLPIDPATGKPFDYQPDGDGFIIRSIRLTDPPTEVIWHWTR